MPKPNLKSNNLKKKYSIFILNIIFSLIFLTCISTKNIDDKLELKFLEQEIQPLNQIIKTDTQIQNLEKIMNIKKENNKLPIAVFHGIGDACDGSMLFWTNYFGEISSVYSRCIESGANIKSELNSIINQGEAACKIIKSDPNFQNDFIIVGFSQGGLIGRYILEK